MDRFCVDVCQRVGYLVSIFFELCFPNLFIPTWDDDLHLSGMALTRGSTKSCCFMNPWLVASPFMYGLASFLMYPLVI